MLRIFVWSAALLALLVTAPGAAGAQLGDPRPLGPVPASAGVFAVAPDGAGGADVLLGGYAGLTAVHAGADDALSRTAVGATGVWSAVLLRAPVGRRVVLWSGPDGVRAARDDGAEGSFGAPQRLDDGRTQPVQGVAAGDGTAVALWGPRYAISRDGEPFGAAQPWPAGGDPTNGVVLAGGRDGTIVAAWPGSDHRGVLAAALAPGADAFGPAEAVPGITAVNRPAVVVLEDGTAVVSGDGTSVVRRAPDGRYGAVEPVVGAAPGRPALAVAADGTLGLVDDAGPVRVASAPAGGTFGAARLLGVDDVYLPVRPLVWPGGTVAAFGSGTCCDSGTAIAELFPADGGGPLAVGGWMPTDGFAGTAPGSFTAYTAADGTLYREDFPSTPDHRRAKVWAAVTTTAGAGAIRTVNPWTHAATVQLRADKAVRLHATARIRRAGQWRTLRPRFRVAARLTGPSTDLVGPFAAPSLRVPLPGLAHACTTGRHWPVDVTVRATDRAGDVVVHHVRFTARCR